MAYRPRWHDLPFVLAVAGLALLAVSLHGGVRLLGGVAAALLALSAVGSRLLLGDALARARRTKALLVRSREAEVAHRVRLEEERVANGAQLRAANEAARAAARARTEFLSNIGHEIRTPLNGIVGMAELAFETELTDEQHEYLGAVRGSAESLLSIVDAVLDFSKLEAGKLLLERRRFVLREVVESAVRPLRGSAVSKGLRLCVEIDDVPARLLGDDVRLRQVLTCLTSNAIKFTDAGSVTVRVGVLQRDPSGAMLLFGVEDTGVGIAPEKQKLVFDAFRQADGSSTRRHGGVGLGLAVSKNLVELLGGQLWLESAPARGSAFFFTARFAIDSSAPREIAADVPLVPALERLLVTRRERLDILVAEDNEVNQEFVTHLLLQRGHQVSLVENGEQAVRAVSKGSFDLVLMDVEMPGMDGVEATRQIRAAGFRLPIIALTGHAGDGEAARFLAAGMNGHLSKPFSVSELARVLEAVWQGAAPTMPLPPAIDTSDLFERVGGDVTLFREVAAMFCRELPKQLAAIRASMEAGDAKGLERTAHSLKGACAVVGATAAARLASVLEETGESGTVDGSVTVFGRLEQELGAAAAMLGAREGLEAR